MKKSNLKSLKLNKQQVSNLGDILPSIKGGNSGGHTSCLPTNLRSNNYKTCVYVCQNTVTMFHCDSRN